MDDHVLIRCRDVSVAVCRQRRLMGGVMEGRAVLVSGVRNKWSIAWHIARAIRREGGTIAWRADDPDQVRTIVEGTAYGAYDPGLYKGGYESRTELQEEQQKQSSDEMWQRLGKPAPRRKVGTLETFRSGAPEAVKRCRKWK